jgi:taurine transport system substrate-binding protein
MGMKTEDRTSNASPDRSKRRLGKMLAMFGRRNAKLNTDSHSAPKQYGVRLATHAGLAAICMAGLAGQPALAGDKVVDIGYQLMVNPWKVAIADHAFEKATGYTIHWHQFSSGGQAIKALASGAIQITSAGSVPIAAAVSNGLPVQLFWILEGIGSNEELVVRNGAGIASPKDLAGKPIGVPVGSTSDLDLYYALKQWGVQARVLDMQPDAIVAGWTRGDIDAAFVWDPALSRIKRTGKVMITSGQICEKSGICTYDGLAVDKNWAAKHPQFMTAFVKVLGEYYAKYNDNPGAWTPGSAMVSKIVKLNGANPKDVPGILKGYIFPDLKQQVSTTWLGANAGKSMAISAKFLSEIGQLGQPGSDAKYSAAVTTEWVDKALAQ